MALIAGSWLLNDAALKARIAHDLRHKLRADVATWAPTTEQDAMIDEALSLAYDGWRQYWFGEGIAVATLDAWDMREHWQYQLMLCHLGRSEFFREDPRISDWPTEFCDAVDAYTSGDPTPFSDVDQEPLPRVDTEQSARKQPKYTNRNGLRGDAHDRRNDWDAASVTRSGDLPPFTSRDSCLRSDS